MNRQRLYHAPSDVWRYTGGLAVVVVVAWMLYLAVPQDARYAATHEDGVTAWIGALGLLAASVWLLAGFLRLRRSSRSGTSLAQVFLLGLGVVFFFGFGEEISWGQRIFGVETPDALRSVNSQQETNLHNLYGSNLFGMNEYRLFTLFWYPYVLLAPLLAAVWPAARRFFARLVPLVLWPFGLLYVVNDVMGWIVGRSLADDPLFGAAVDATRVELREIIFSLLCALTGYLVLRAVKSANAPATHAGGAPGSSSPTDGRGSHAAAFDVLAV